MKKSIYLRGDSISIHYRDFLSKYLAAKLDMKWFDEEGNAFLNLDVPTGGNGGDSRMMLNYIKELEASGKLDFDIFVFNCGLHDIKRDITTGATQIPFSEYEANLKKIIAIAKENGIKPIWINTTPVDDNIHNTKCKAFSRYNRDVLKVNEIASKVMGEEGITIIDLYGFTKALGSEAYCDHVHYKEEVRALHAAFIAGSIEQAVN